MFQSRGRDLLIGNTFYSLINLIRAVSVPWSGFINRKLIKLLFILVAGQFQSRGRDLLIGN